MVGSFLDRGNSFTSSPDHPDQLWDSISLLASGYWGLYCRGKMARS
jgi:hypothetical protein